jgi:ABC-2 type transport system ATP-binding protein
MGEVVIEAEGLTKRYGGFTAVDNLNLQIERGEVFGLLGPNGSGKTTTILMLLGLTEPTAGRIKVLGFDPVRQPLSVKARVGYLPDQIGFYDELTARENLIYIARLNGLSRSDGYRRIDDALERMGLGEVADRVVGAFSRGMRQRLGVAELLIKQPQVIIMDEPTLGLDPEAARLFLDIIRDLKADGITILLSSHLLYQVQAVCDRVGLFNRGRMMLEGRVETLARDILGGAYRVHLHADGEAQEIIDALRKVPEAIDVTFTPAGPNGKNVTNTYVVEAERDLRADAAAAVVCAGGRLLELHVETPSLDEIYSQYFRHSEDAQKEDEVVYERAR